MPTLNQYFLNDTHYLDDTGATGVSMAASFNTTKTYTGTPGNPAGGFALDKGRRYCVQAVWPATGTPIGVLKLQWSNDNTNWTDVDGSNVNVSGPAGSTVWRDWCDAKFLRAVYTRTSGGT